MRQPPCRELHIPARFVQCDVYALPDHLDDKFDVVYTSGTGLILEFLNEYEKTFYQRLPYMEKVDDRWWTIPGYRLPLMFTIGARKPA